MGQRIAISCHEPVAFVPDDWPRRKLREWLLLLLRFAVTREAADEAAAKGMADELDAVGLRASSAVPGFFLRTTAELCAAIVAADGPARSAVLKQHLGRIDDRRLRRAFAAAVGIDQASEARSGRNGTGRGT